MIRAYIGSNLPKDIENYDIKKIDNINKNRIEKMIDANKDFYFRTPLLDKLAKECKEWSESIDRTYIYDLGIFQYGKYSIECVHQSYGKERVFSFYYGDEKKLSSEKYFSIYLNDKLIDINDYEFFKDIDGFKYINSTKYNDKETAKFYAREFMLHCVTNVDDIVTIYENKDGYVDKFGEPTNECNSFKLYKILELRFNLIETFRKRPKNKLKNHRVFPHHYYIISEK